MEISNQNGKSDRYGRSGAQAIVPPATHEGVGNALRSVFGKSIPGMPDDMRRLLSQLDS